MHGNLAESASPPGKWQLASRIILVSLVVYWGSLFYATHTVLPPNLLPGNSDKLIHFGAYSGLAILLMSLRALRGPYTWASLVWRWLILAVFGVFDELTQLLVNRHADLTDWIADVVGVTVGLTLVSSVTKCFSASIHRQRDCPPDEALNAD